MRRVRNLELDLRDADGGVVRLDDLTAQIAITFDADPELDTLLLKKKDGTMGEQTNVRKLDRTNFM